MTNTGKLLLYFLIASSTVAATAAKDLAQLKIFPGNSSVSMRGADGADVKIKDGVIEIRRVTPTKRKNLSKVLRMFSIAFKPELLPLDKASNGAQLVVKLRKSGKFSLLKSNTISAKWSGARKSERYAATESFTDSNQWQELVMPVPDTLFPVRVLFLQLGEGDYDIKEIAIRKPRNISLDLVSDPLKNAKMFTVSGITDVPGKVILVLTGLKGKKYVKTVEPVNGKFTYTWNNPPLTPVADNKLQAIVGNGKDALNVSLPLNIYGYRDNYDYAWLKVDGKRIVTARDGKEFIPVGIGYAKGVIIKPQDDAVMKFCKGHHLNTVRLAFYTRIFNGDYNRPIDMERHIAKHIEPVVDAARRHDMYVILDDHEYFHEKIDEKNARGKQKSRVWSEATVQRWIKGWEAVAKKYKDDPHVLGYELQNEPFGMPPAQVRDFYGRCIKAIRKIDKKHIILVGTYNWSHARALEKTWGGFTKSIDAPYNNVVFAFHDYPKDNHPWIVQKHITEFQKRYNVPVLCTEFGATHWQHGETDCRKFIAGMLALAAQERFGWMIWALGTLEDNPRNPYNEVDNKNGPKRFADSCAYSDLWPPVARIMGTPFPAPAK